MARAPRIEEPTFVDEMSTIDLMNTLNWYHQNKEYKDGVNYIQDYAKKNKIPGRINTKKSILTLAWVCRLVANGNNVGPKGLNFMKNEIKNVMEIEDTTPVVKVDTGPVITIQDRIREKVSECIGELEGQIDELVTSGFKTDVSPYGVMHTLDIKGIHANRVVEFFKKKRQQFDEAMNTTDKDLKEGYSNFNKTQLKKLVAYCDQVIVDGAKISGAAVKNRKPRKRKMKSSTELVAKIKYCQKFDDLKLVSVAPKEIIGAMQLWVYNTKTRKLGCYQAEDAGGFSVKGTSLLNYNKDKSIQKTLRKPEITTAEVLTAGKITLKKLLDNIKAVDSPLSGRINEDIILMKVTK
jgi:hypothetical protein